MSLHARVPHGHCLTHDPACPLPRPQNLCLITTSAAVRVGAFQAMGKLVPRVDQAEAAGMLAVMAQVGLPSRRADIFARGFLP
jgi:hypothetical protein